MSLSRSRSLSRRLLVVLVAATLVAGTAYGVGWATRGDGGAAPAPRAVAPPADPSTPAVDDPVVEPVAPAEPVVQPVADPVPAPEPPPEPEPEPELVPGPALLSQGESGDRVRDLQARLKQIAWFDAGVTGYYGDVTAAAVRGFQAKREIPVTGYVDQRTLDRLYAMTRTPSEAELLDRVETPDPQAGPLDPRCLTGRVLCVDKTTRTLRWVVDGQVLTSVDVRFGGEYTPTREGLFSVQRMSRDHVSSLYDTPMPYAMFFSGGQAVHYSPDFAANGYNGASHGCVNVRDHARIAWIYDQVRIGDRVVVSWS